MSILSVWFIGFLLIAAVLYYGVPDRMRPYVLLAASVWFYTRSDLRYGAFLLLTVTTVYGAARILDREHKEFRRKMITGLTLGLNLGILAAVKYLPYLLGQMEGFVPLDLTGISDAMIVPLGISFYTLQLSGYLIDVYRRNYKAERDYFRFASFSCFFPLMLQGPISRYPQLAPQLFRRKRPDEIYKNLTYGAQLMLWGYFKKLVIADRAALLVNTVFENHGEYAGLTVFFAVVFYTIQIYTDFSGCVDICRGAAQLFGIQLVENFRQPYFSSSVRDYWTRWHRSLSGWLRDYVYISLGGNRKGTFRKYVNLILVFLVSGLWHGVGFHFLVWGAMQAAFQIIGALTLPYKQHICDKLGIQREKGWYLQVRRLITFGLILVSRLIFRAPTTTAAMEMFCSIFRGGAAGELFPGLGGADVMILCVAVLILFFLSCCKERGICVREGMGQLWLPVRWAVFLLLFAVILIFGVYGPGYSEAAFIYMNF